MRMWRGDVLGNRSSGIRAQDIVMKQDNYDSTDILPGTAEASWWPVLRDVLEFQFKLVVDGIKDFALAQVALGAALIDLVLRDGSPGRRFYGIVRVSDRFDRWLDLHAVSERAPADTVDLGPVAARSVDDVLDGLETSARRVAEVSSRVTRHGVLRGA